MGSIGTAAPFDGDVELALAMHPTSSTMVLVRAMRAWGFTGPNHDELELSFLPAKRTDTFAPGIFFSLRVESISDGSENNAMQENGTDYLLSVGGGLMSEKAKGAY